MNPSAQDSDPQAAAYLALFRHSPFAILMLAPGRALGNDAACALVGCGLDGCGREGCGRLTAADLFDLDDPVVAQFFARLAQAGHAAGDFRLRRGMRPALLVNVDGVLFTTPAGECWQVLQLRQPGAAAAIGAARSGNEVGLRAVVDAMPDLFWLKDTAGVYLMCNRAYEEFAGVSEADIIGRTNFDLADHGAADRFRLHDADAMLSDVPVVREEWATFRASGRRALMRTTKARVRSADGTVLGVLGISRDITEQRRQEDLLQANNAVLGLIARGAPLAETLARICCNLEERSPDMLCSVMLLSEDARHIQFGAGPSLPADYAALIDGLEIGPAVGSCGTAAYRGEAVFVEDIQKSALWLNWRDGAQRFGLRACWSTPIRAASGEILGTFAVYYREPRAATPDDLRLIGLVTTIASVAIESSKLEADRARVEAQLQEHQARLALALEGSGTGVWDRDVQARVVKYSPGWKALFGFAENDEPSRAEDSVGRLHPDDLPHVKRAFQACLAGETEIYAAEHRVRCKDGSYKWVVSRGKVVDRDADGKPRRMIGATTDINDMKALAEELRQQRDLITNLTNQVPGMVYQYRRMADGSDFFPYASEGIRAIYELAPDDVAHDACAIEQRVHPEDRALYALSLTVSGDQLTPWHLEYRVVLPRQGVAWRLGDARPQRLPDGSVLWHGFITDISERKRLEKTILENEEKYRTVTENSPDVIIRYDRELQRIYANQRYEELAGQPLRGPNGVLTEDAEVLGVENAVALHARLREVIASGTPADLEMSVVQRGRERIFHTRALPEFDGRGEVATVLTFSHDITERKRLEAELQQLATTDFLTGLPNRRHFVTRLTEELARIQRLGVPRTSVLLIDIDHFKKINDTHGHAVGDEVLKHFADLARGALRRIDTVGRVGGEEFALILPGADVKDAIVFAERFRKKVEATRVAAGGHEIAFTISLGISAIDPADPSADAILSRTDKALYAAKENGRNRFEVISA